MRSGPRTLGPTPKTEPEFLQITNQMVVCKKVLNRAAQAVVRQRLREYPAVLLVGPRQCGKATLALALGGDYFALEQDADRVRLDLAWPDVASSSRRVILDEAQSWPADCRS